MKRPPRAAGQVLLAFLSLLIIFALRPDAGGPRPHPSVAVCLADDAGMGGDWDGVVVRNADLVHHHLLDPLDADVFVYANVEGKEGLGKRKNGTGKEEELFKAATKLERTLRGLFDRTHDFTRGPLRFDSARGEFVWPNGRGAPYARSQWGRLMGVRVLGQQNEKGGAAVNFSALPPSWDFIKQRMKRDKKLETKDGERLLPSSLAMGLAAARSRRTCLEMVRAGETTRSRELGLRNFRYDAIVWTRMRFVHFAPPFPTIPALLAAGQNTVYMAESPSYGDRFAVVPRHMADWFFGQWELMVNGSFVLDGKLLPEGADVTRMSDLYAERTATPGWKLARAGPWPFALACELELDSSIKGTNITISTENEVGIRRKIIVRYRGKPEERQVCVRFPEELGWLEDDQSRKSPLPFEDDVEEVGKKDGDATTARETKKDEEKQVVLGAKSKRRGRRGKHRVAVVARS